ncbi:MAG: T9SS C-terminal target domain-containing protein [Candidatus Zixiibacteriota bacterium]|nr:MAG: T9SS C-terminal target domain-containing protein [candidate division Zixibacteria bacterium]
MRPFLRFIPVLLLAALIAIPGWAQVKINEVMVNDISTDDSTYVELYGPANTVLTGYQLVGVNGFNGQEYATIDLVGIIPSDGFFVIGEIAMPGVDLVNALVDFQNGPDNILLKNGGNVVDAIGYGIFDSVNVYFVGEGDPTPDQPPGSSLSRNPDGHDTGNNADDFELTTFLTPGAPNQFPGVVPFYTLAEIRASQASLMGQLIWTTGIANSPSGLFGGTSTLSAYMQDDQAGVNVFGGSATFAVGDCLWVKGTVGEYNGLLEIMNALEINVGPNVTTPDPIPVNCQIALTAGEALEGMLVHLGDVWIPYDTTTWPAAGQNNNVYLTDTTGAELIMRIDKDTELDGWADHPEPFEHFTLTAILNEYNVYQVLPRFQSDFGELVGVAPLRPMGAPADFRLEGVFPNPFNPSTKVRFSLPQASQVRLEAFTMEGRRLAELAQGSYPAGQWEVTWDAAGLPSGIYLLRLSAGSQAQTVKALLLK